MESTPFGGGSTESTPVEPVRPLAGYIGGKRNLARRLTARLDAMEGVEIYAEPFVGMGGVFLRRTRRPRAEVINDGNRDVANLFRIIQRHYQPFLDMIRWQLATRADFERLCATDPDTLTDLERAARFLYLQRMSFGGRVASRSFAISPAQPARFDTTKLVPMLEDVHARLAGVTIECLSYAEFIRRYDRPGTLFYLDPPYVESESDYGRGLFGREDFARLAEQLAAIDGRFVLSINDHPVAREAFGRFELEEVTTTYTTGKQRSRTTELIVTGPAR